MPGTSCQSPKMLPNIFRNIIYSEIYHLDNFDVLFQNGFGFIKNHTFSNLCKTYLDSMIIPFFNFHFEWKSLRRRRELLYFRYFENEKRGLSEKKAFFMFFKGFLLVKYNNIIIYNNI